MDKLSESAFRDRHVVPYARANGWLVYFTWRSDHSPAGFPDLVLLRYNRLIFAELKTDKGKLTADQDHWLKELSHVPVIETYIWRPKDWLLIEKVLMR